jgi:hypothetical protein
MRQPPRLLPALALAAVALTAPSASSAEGLGYEASAEFHPNYYWRGGYIWEKVPSLMPSVTASWNVLWLNAWAAIPFSDRDILKPVRDEIDLTLGADFDLGDTAALSVGAIAYLYPNAMDTHTEELFGVLSIDPADWGVDIGIYGDVNAYRGVYLHVTPRYSLPISDALTLDAKLTLSNGFYSESYAFLEIAPSAMLTVSTETFDLYGGLLGAYNPDADDFLWDAVVGVSTSF